MKLTILFTFLFLFLIGSAQVPEIIKRWAPIHLQNISSKGKNGLKGRSDKIAAIDYDQDWNATNNWENIEKYSLTPTVYYSVIESKHYFFLTYAFFHPRDYSKIRLLGIGEHENDLEGVLLIIEKTNSKFGDLVGAITIFHNQFLKYNKTAIRLDPSENRPITYQQSGGHGLKMANTKQISGKNNLSYYPTINPIHNQFPLNQSYRLTDIFTSNGLWELRNDTLLFDSTGNFRGDNGNGAKPPWKWDSKRDDKDNTTGEIATDPFKLANNYFELTYPNDTNYLSNPYK